MRIFGNPMTTDPMSELMYQRGESSEPEDELMLMVGGAGAPPPKRRLIDPDRTDAFVLVDTDDEMSAEKQGSTPECDLRDGEKRKTG